MSKEHSELQGSTKNSIVNIANLWRETIKDARPVEPLSFAE